MPVYRPKQAGGPHLRERNPRSTTETFLAFETDRSRGVSFASDDTTLRRSRHIQYLAKGPNRYQKYSQKPNSNDFFRSLQDLSIDLDDLSESERRPTPPVKKKDPKTMRHLDMVLWRNMPPSVFKKRSMNSSAISFVTSAWNYLFSTDGVGVDQPISGDVTEEVLTDNDMIDFTVENSTVNEILMQWFKTVCISLGTKGEASLFYKPIGRASTKIPSEDAGMTLKADIKKSSKIFLYHCHNRLLVALGIQAEKTSASVKRACIAGLSVIFCDLSSGDLVTLRWSDIVADLQTCLPYYMDVLGKSEGILLNPRNGTGNSHCIISFEAALQDTQATRNSHWCR